MSGTRNKKQTKRSRPETTVVRRRSPRDTQRLVLPGPTSLAFRRWQELFFAPQSSSSVSCLGRLASLHRVHSNPNVYVVDNFLYDNELAFFDRFIDTAEQNKLFGKSFVDNSSNATEGPKATAQTKKQKMSKTSSNTIFDDTHRTSSFVNFPPRDNTAVAAVERRVTDWLATSGDALEGLQLVRYRPRQFFGLHHDLGDLEENENVNKKRHQSAWHVPLPNKHALVPRRLLTVFCYLNDVRDGGGETHFPLATNGVGKNDVRVDGVAHNRDGLRVAPRAGRAVFFSNVRIPCHHQDDNDDSGEGCECPVVDKATSTTFVPDVRTVHAGLPPTGETNKYGLNIWIREDYGK